MRFFCILLLLVVTLLMPETDGWRRRRRRRWFRVRIRGRRILKYAGKAALGAVFRGRDVPSIDVNKDGKIDQSEVKALTSEERVARDLLTLADQDGDSVVSVDEFERSVRDLMLSDADELGQHETDDADFID